MISLAEVKKAYNAIGYGVCDCMFIDENTKSCCPLSALAIKDGAAETSSSIIAFLNRLYGSDFVEGFASGFDGCVYNEVYDKSAFDNGLRIRKGLHVK